MPNTTPYYLFFDFDETIFIDKTVPKATELAIKTAQAKGCKVYMNTGRTLKHLLDDLNPATDIKFDGYLSSFNAITLNLENPPILEGKNLTHDETVKLIDYSIRKSYWSVIQTESTSTYTIKLEGDVVYSPAELEVFRKEAIDFIRDKKILKYNIYPPKSKNFTSDDIETALDGYAWIKNSHGYEGHFANEDKGTLLKKFAEITGYDFDKFIVFGDSPNDVGAFNVAKTSVAMACSTPKIKELATYVATEKEGVAQYINEVLLKKL